MHIKEAVLHTEAEAREWMPVTADMTLYKDAFNGRWLVFDKLQNKSRSRSWSLYGEFKSMCMVLSWAWQQWAIHSANKCPHDWIAEALNDD